MRRVLELVAGVLARDVESLGDQTTPLKNLEGWDSLKHVMLIVGLENTFQTNLSAEDIQRMTSVAEICQVFAERGIDG